MKLYHGGLVEIKVPRIIVGDHIGDFGVGFYTTTSIQQARRFVKTKCDREQKTSGVVSYTHSALLKRMHESREMFRQIIDTLKENGSIVAEEAESGGRKPLVYYRLVQ
jgi:hypothetical protein